MADRACARRARHCEAEDTGVPQAPASIPAEGTSQPTESLFHAGVCVQCHAKNPSWHNSPEAIVHAQIKRRRVPIRAENFHSGGATTLSFVVQEANVVGTTVMRSETSGNILCRLTARHWACDSLRKFTTGTSPY